MQASDNRTLSGKGTLGSAILPDRNQQQDIQLLLAMQRQPLWFIGDVFI